MKKLLKFSVLLVAAGLVFGLAGCDDGSGKDEKGPGGGGDDGIKWSNDANATLTVINNTTKDIVLFHGNTPSISNILGGVRGGNTREINVEQKVGDFGIGGYMILRGVTLAEYNANKDNLGNARLEYSAMATYGQGRQYRTEISPSYMGDNGFRLTNIGKLGIEVRQGSPDGAKVAYLPALSTNTMVYADNTTLRALYPVYVYFNRQTGDVTTLKPTQMTDMINAGPRPLTDSSIPSYYFPQDQNATWDSIKNSLVAPNAYVTVINNVGNQQAARVTLAGSSWLTAQNGYDGIIPGEVLTYEIEGSATGRTRDIRLVFFEGAVNIPVQLNGATPSLKNGYDYTITVAGGGNTAADYTVTIEESDEPRDLSDVIDTL